jgi:hypothetical protein
MADGLAGMTERLVTDSEAAGWEPDVADSKLFASEPVARLLATRSALIEALEHFHPNRNIEGCRFCDLLARLHGEGEDRA